MLQYTSISACETSFYTQRLQSNLYNFMYSDIVTFNLEFSKTNFFNINNGIPLEKPVNVPK